MVMMFNDDFTPMDFVVDILETIFFKSQAEAEAIMLKVHHEEKAVVGTYSYGEVTALEAGCELHGFEGPLPCLLLEWADLGSLQDMIARGPMDQFEAQNVLSQVPFGLYELHRLPPWGVLHRVIKPGNILGFTGSSDPKNPKIKLTDFGVALERTVTDWDEYVGRFEAIQDVEVMPRVSGAVTRIGFREGLEVAKGTLLFEIDPRPYRAALAQAQASVAAARATLANAQTELARARSLLDQQAVSKEEYEQKLAAVRSGEANLASAQAAVRARALDVEFTQVRAPVSGRVSDKRVALGDYVTSGQTLLTRIVSVNPIWFTFDGAEAFYLKYIRQARSGERASSRYAPNPVEIQLADENDYRWRGRMVFVDNAIDTGSGTIRAHAEVANPDGFLVPGMFGRARLLGSGSYRAMLIPDEAIVTDQTRRIVYVIGKDGKTAPRNVETGPLVEGLRVVKTGLTPRDRVVLDGLARLQPGVPVNARMTQIKPRAKNDAPVANPIETPQPAEATAS